MLKLASSGESVTLHYLVLTLFLSVVKIPGSMECTIKPIKAVAANDSLTSMGKPVMYAS